MSKHWWGTQKRISDRLRSEIDTMMHFFGSTFRLEWDPPARLFWIGTVDINLVGLRYREHTIKIVYPDNYPNRAPEAYVVSPTVYSPKHQFEDGQLCLFNPKDGANFGWNPAMSRASTVAAWSIEWIYAFYTWRATGKWPGIEERLTKDRARWFGRR